MTPELIESGRRLERELLVVGAYRWLIGTAFLLAAFAEFPAHKWALALGLLTFNAAIESIGLVAQACDHDRRTWDDASDRKTRHAIVLATQYAGQKIDMEYFWPAVVASVRDEARELDGPAPERPGYWARVGLYVGSFMWRLVGDIIGIGIAMAITGG